MAANALAPCVIKTSVTMPLTTQDHQVLVFHGEGLQLSAPYEYWEMTENVDMFLFPKINCKQQALRKSCLNSLSFSDALWHHKIWSPLVQLLTCYLMAPYQDLNRCWHIINKVQWHWKGKFPKRYPNYQSMKLSCNFIQISRGPMS